MADLLGEVDVNIPSRRQAPAKTIKNDSRRKIRVLSPPLSKSHHLENNKIRAAASTLETPPRGAQDIDDDNGFQVNGDDQDDIAMSDQPLPSSPVTRVVERKANSKIKIEEEEDDMMEIAQVVGHAADNHATVNISGSRPAAKAKKDYPTPGSSSPSGPRIETMDASSWNDITSKLNVINSSPTTATLAPGKLQSQDVCEEDGSLRFFWTDYTEINGCLLLFGKVRVKKSGAFASGFVKIDNILRKLYFLPRTHRQKNGRKTSDEVDMGDVYEEVDTLMTKSKVGMHKIKPCTRKYAFELPAIPREGEYLKLLYPYDKPALPVDLQGETFSHVFGTNTSLFEQFVLWKNIMGPCWLKIEDADFNAVHNASWCKLELQVARPSVISTLGDSDNMDVPPLTLMSIALRTTMNVKDNRQEILMISARVYENVSLTDTTAPEKLPCKTFTIMRPNGEGFPSGFKLDIEKHTGVVKLEKSEQTVLSLFLAQLERIDPDVLIGHRLEDVDYSLLLSRLRERKTPGWHRIGRLRRSEWPKNIGRGGGSFFTERQMVAGRLMCDLANDQGKVSYIMRMIAMSILC